MNFSAEKIQAKGQKTGSLPPLRLSNKNQYLKPMQAISKRLELYFKLRTSSKIVINTPIECFLPSGSSENHQKLIVPTGADIVMSPMPPQENNTVLMDLKYSRLFEATAAAKKRKDNSFLIKSFKANEHPNNLNPIKKKRNEHVYRKEKKIQLHREKQSKSSIPFLSDILNKVYKQSSKMLFSQNSILEIQGTPHECVRKSSYVYVNESPNLEVFHRTNDVSLQTERPVPPEANKRRVIYNRNSSMKCHSKKVVDETSYSSDEN